MASPAQSFQTLDCPTRLAFEVTLPHGTTAAFVTTGESHIKADERYWNSYDGELYQVTNIDDETIEASLEFGCDATPISLTFDREWFIPDGHRLHHVAPITP